MQGLLSQIQVRHSRDVSSISQGHALTIGNFDGCHLGHQKLISRTLETSNRLGLSPASLTFFPRPEIFFHPERAADGSLFSESMKSRAFHELSVATHFIQEFNASVSQMTPDHFFKNVLLDQLHARAIVVGENFRFGQNRSGDTRHLQKCGTEHDISTIVENFALQSDQVVSSTRIRSALRQGDVEEAARLLGRPYLLEGTLKKGDQLGRMIGFPTLNLSVEQQLIPGNGVYSGFVWVEGISKGTDPLIMNTPSEALPAAFNIGLRPTVGGKSLRIEAHILSEFPVENCYERISGFYFSHRIRAEMKFENLDQLKLQISNDTAIAREMLGA